MRKLFILTASIFSMAAGAQMVEKSQSSSQESRRSSSRSVDNSVSLNIGGLYFGLLGMIEAVGPSAVGYSDEDIRIERERYEREKESGAALLGAGLLDEWRRICVNFSRKSYTYSHTPELARMMQQTKLGRLSAEDATPAFFLKWSDQIYAGEWAEMSFGKPFHHANRFSCIARQAAVIDQALKRLREVAPLKFEVPNEELLRKSLRYGAETWPQSSVVGVLSKAWPTPETLCNIPTPIGVKGGKTIVSCGPLEYDAENRRFAFAGTVMLDQDTVNGRRVAFVDSRESQDSRASTSSKGKKASATVAN